MSAVTLRCASCGNEAGLPRQDVESTKGGAHVYVVIQCDNGHPPREMARVMPTAAGDVLTTGRE